MGRELTADEDADPHLSEREREVARREARVEAAIAAQKDLLQRHERELAEARVLRAELAGRREREEAARRALAEREETLDSRELDLDTRAHEVETLERELEALRRDLAEREQALVERELGLEERARELADLERLVDRRDKLALRRELETARSAIEVAVRETRSVQRTVERAFEPEAEVPTAGAEPRGGPADERRAGVTLELLQRLVEASGKRHPERIDEWEAYIFFLREYATADEPLPATFDALIDDVFAPLLDDFG